MNYGFPKIRFPRPGPMPDFPDPLGLMRDVRFKVSDPLGYAIREGRRMPPPPMPRHCVAGLTDLIGRDIRATWRKFGF
jgi:hypothetical protein